MRTKKTATLLALISLTAVGAYFCVDVLRFERKAAKGPESQPSKSDEARQIVRSLTSRVHALEREVAIQHRAVSTGEVTGPDHAVNTEVPHAPPQDLAKRQNEALMEYEDQLSRIVTAEFVDKSWQTEVEASLAQVSTELGPEIELESTRCGGSLCAIKFSHEQSSSHTDLFQKLQDGPALGFGGPALLRRHPQPEGGYRTTIFLAQPGGSLPEVNGAMSGRLMGDP